MFRIRWLDKRRIPIPTEYKELNGLKADYFQMSQVKEVQQHEGQYGTVYYQLEYAGVGFYIVPAYLFPPEDRAILDSLRPKWNR